MKPSRFTEEQIIGILREQDVFRQALPPTTLPISSQRVIVCASVWMFASPKRRFQGVPDGVNLVRQV